MTEKEIKERINSFSRWHYQFDINGIKTPTDSPEKVNRHLQRKKYFFDPLLSLLDGSLMGKTVLDLGCNAGFWSLLSIENNCKYVLGIDGRKMHIDQANFIFDVKDVAKEKYSFIQEDIYNYFNMTTDQFDIIYCMGLLYHINNPIELLENICRINKDIILIDTSINDHIDPIMILQKENISDPRNSLKSEFILLPSYKVISEIIMSFGYQGVMLKPNFSDYSGATEYQNGSRKAFIFAKTTDLSVLYPLSEKIF